MSGVSLVVVFWNQIWIRIRGLFFLPFNQVISDIPSGIYVSRKDLNTEVETKLKDDLYRTVVLYGPRGSGKSTLIKKFLQGRRAAIQIDFEEGDDTTQRIAEHIGMAKEFSSRARLSSMFRWCLWQDPVVVLSLNNEVSAKTFGRILNYCKTMSYDKAPDKKNKFSYSGCPRFVVDVSLSRSALSNGISPLACRFLPVKVGDLNASEVSTYLEKRLDLKFKKGDDASFSRAIQKEIEALKCYNINFLQAVCGELCTKPCPHIDAAREIIEHESNDQVQNCSDCWATFRDNFEAYFLEKKILIKEVHKRLETFGNLLLDAFAEHYNNGTTPSKRKKNNDDTEGNGKRKDGAMYTDYIITTLQKPDIHGNTATMTAQRLSEWNARTDGIHMFDIDRIQGTIGLSGQFAFKALTQEMINLRTQHNQKSA